MPHRSAFAFDLYLRYIIYIMYPFVPSGGVETETSICVSCAHLLQSLGLPKAAISHALIVQSRRY